jgi:hypothetical protein
MVLWSCFLFDQLARGVPMWVICPLDADGWVDLFLGPVTATQFFSLRVPPAEFPLTTDIPYKVDDEFVRRIHDLLERSLLEQAAPSA